LAVADSLVRDGHVLDAIATLSAENRRENSCAIERRLVDLRHEAWALFANAQPVGEWPRPVPDLLRSPVNPPECSRAELTADVLASAIQHYGSLLVRGLLAPAWCEQLRADIDRAIDSAREWTAHPAQQHDSEWFAPFAPAAHELGPANRKFLCDVATGYAAESPRTLFHLLDALDEAGCDRLLAEYFGERPAFSLIKTAFRRTPPDTPGGWHQDGYVAGRGTRTVNIWAVVSPCGSIAPGLDLLPRRMDAMLPTRKDLPIDFAIATEVVEELARETPVVRPEFNPGDALLFDQFLVHQTGWRGTFSRARYGFECWFFAPSTFPVKWYPFVY
jgi:hypothetical protein